MHTYKSLAVFAALISTILAVPLTSSSSISKIMPRGNATILINDCGNSSFENQSSGGSPLISDCQILAENIRGDGTWTTWGSGRRQLAQLGTCAFGVQVEGITLTTFYKVGNEDIRDLIFESINRFGWQGKVGAKGNMPCQPGDSHVEWAIYHT
jgi:hypothetical protein